MADPNPEPNSSGAATATLDRPITSPSVASNPWDKPSEETINPPSSTLEPTLPTPTQAEQPAINSLPSSESTSTPEPQIPTPAESVAFVAQETPVVPTPKVPQAPIIPAAETPTPLAETTAINPNQPEIDKLNAERDLKLQSTLGNTIQADRKVIGKIDSELASLGVSSDPQPSYLGTPPGWDSEKPSVEIKQALSAPVILQTSEPVTPQPVASEPIAAAVAPKSEGFFNRVMGLLRVKNQQPA